MTTIVATRLAVPEPLFASVGRSVVSRVLAARDRVMGYPTASLPDSTLGALDQALVRAVAETFFPPGGPIAVSGSDAGLVAYVGRYVELAGAPMRVLLHLLLLYVELSPLMFGPRRARFTDLSPLERWRSLEGARTSRLYFRRVVFTSLRALMTMGYLADERVCEQIGIRADIDPFGLGKQEDKTP